MKGGTNCGAGGGAPILKSNIIVTTEEDSLVGLDVVLSLNGNTVQTKTFTDSKQVVFTVKVAGNYELTCGEATASVNVSILGIDYTAELSLIKEVTIDVYGGAMENIAMTADDGTSTQLTTNASGKTVATVKMNKSYTFSGGVSGYVKNVTIVDDSAVYVMPDGALYWYGNNISNLQDAYDIGYTPISGSGWIYQKSQIVTNVNSLTYKATAPVNTNRVNGVSTGLIDITEANKLNIVVDNASSGKATNNYLDIYCSQSKTQASVEESRVAIKGRIVSDSKPNPLPKKIYTFDLSSESGSRYIGTASLNANSNSETTIYALWLE